MSGKLYHRIKKNGKWTWVPCKCKWVLHTPDEVMTKILAESEFHVTKED